MPAPIYDFGMNNGDDVEYYLLKGARVVAVEANSKLCDVARQRFADAIEDNRLTILNVALSDREQSEPVTFYIHKQDHVLSQLPRPADEDIGSFDAVKVPCRTPAGIVQEFGEPCYVKIDVEHFDAQVLRDLFANGIRPPEISAESHSAEVFALMVANGYRAFNLVEGCSVPQVYANATIATSQGRRRFRFRPHSAGPFGEDLLGRWENADAFFYTLAAAGLGWRDIHASTAITPEPPLSNRKLLLRQGAGIVGRVIVGFRRRYLF